MSITVDQLRRLRRHGGALPIPGTNPAEPADNRHGSPAPPLTDGTGRIVDVGQLRAMVRLRRPGHGGPVTAPCDRHLPGEEIAPGLHLARARVPVDPLPVRLGGAFDHRPDFDPYRVLFFDTETTGLAGGTGTRAFMIGAARWLHDALEVRQLFIATLAAERAMLDEFARWLGPGTLLSSYNGKCYDIPLLRTRYRLARLPDPTIGLGHIDLLYPVRRRYRDMFGNCRLKTIEHAVLHIQRQDDLPGSEAPQAWLTWLRGGSATNLRRVATHNHQDVVSLARLLRHLSGQGPYFFDTNRLPSI